MVTKDGLEQQESTAETVRYQGFRDNRVESITERVVPRRLLNTKDEVGRNCVPVISGVKKKK